MSKKIPAAVALLLAAAVAAPAATASAAPVAELRLSQPRPSPALDELLLRATCSEACTLRLKELNAVPYRTRGGREQLPHSAIDALSISRRLPAGKQVALRFAVPPAVQRAAAEAGARGFALVGYLVAEVSPAGGGEPVQTPRQFTVTGPGTPAPMPVSPYTDAIRLPRATTRRAARTPPRYSVTLEGVQTSSWSYDRTSTDGGCIVLDRGSGRQTLRFRSLRPATIQQVIWRTGELKLQHVGVSFSGLFVPIRIDAERDSRADKGAQGDCGGSGGGGGGDQPQCTRTGSAEIALLGGFIYREALFDMGPTLSAWKAPSTAPDCPVEVAEGLHDPLDLLDARGRRSENLTRGGNPGTVIIILRARDVTRLEGGSVTTNVRYTFTFRKLRQRSSSVM